MTHTLRTVLSSDWEAALVAFLDYCTAAGMLPDTIYTYRQRIGHMAKRIGLGPWEVTGDALVEWCAGQDWARETRRGRTNAFKSFYGWACRSGRMINDPSTALPKVTSGAPNPRPVPDRLYMKALMRTDVRTRLILRLAGECGLRRGEIAQIHSRDLTEDFVGWSLLVHGKGSKKRTVPLTEGIAFELRTLDRGWAFPGKIDGHLSPRRVGELAADALPEDWTLHKCRHRFATRTYMIDRDLLVVQQLLGHASPATTQLYVKVPRDDLRRTVLAAAG